MPEQREYEAVGRQASAGIVNSPPVVLGLIVFLALIHILRTAFGEDWDTWTIFAFAFIPARLGGSEPVPMMEGSQWWSFLTYAFLHAGWLHPKNISLGWINDEFIPGCQRVPRSTRPFRAAPTRRRAKEPGSRTRPDQSFSRGSIFYRVEGFAQFALCRQKPGGN